MTQCFLSRLRGSAGLLAIHLVLISGCATSTSPEPPDLGPRDGPVADRSSAELGTDASTDTSSDATTPDSVTPDAAKADATATSPYLTVRGLYHMHSAYSHDACDEQGLINGQPNAPCVAQLRAAICDNGLDFVFMTDHPSNMSTHTIEQDLYYDAAQGDQLVLEAGKPIANAINCGAGKKRPLLSVGFESSHMMPLGLHELPPTGSPLYDAISDAKPVATIQQQISGLSLHGAVVSMVHSEETDISATTIDSAGFDAMEWYNIHANIKILLGKDKLSVDLANIPALTALVKKLGELDDFITKAANSPHPDLAFLILLDQAPPEGFDKWRSIQRTRPITGLFGSDIHRNVSVDTGMCAGLQQIVCVLALQAVESGLGLTLPGAIKSLVLAGGTITLSDGERIDSYDRGMRWMENRLLVKSFDQASLQQSIREGRAFGVFTIFGDPQGFSFTGTAQGSTLYLGDKAAGPITLRIGAPRPAAMRGAPFTATDATLAEVTVELYRTDAAGTTLVTSSSSPGGTVVQLVNQPGAYHVEIRIRPKHLTTALGSASALAQKDFLWLISNPIYVLP